MSYGLTVTNDYNTVTIDEAYKNYVLTQKITLSVAPAKSDWSHKTTTSGYFSGTKPLVFIRNTSGIGVSYYLGFDPTYGYSISCTAELDTQFVTVTFYVFDIIKTTEDPLTDYGLRVYSSNGELSYTSHYKPLRITSIFSIVGVHTQYPGNNGFASDEPGWSRTSRNCEVANAGTIAAMISQPTSFVYSDLVHQQVVHSMGIGSANYSCKSFAAYLVSLMLTYPIQPFGGQLLFADVSNY